MRFLRIESYVDNDFISLTDKCFCLKMLIGILEHMFMPKWIEEYMLDHIPVLLVDSSSGASTAFHSYFRAIRTGSKVRTSKIEYRLVLRTLEIRYLVAYIEQCLVLKYERCIVNFLPTLAQRKIQISSDKLIFLL